jgi:signal transduction histidine kinase
MFARSEPLYGHRMRRRASIFLRNRRVQNAGDVLLALVLAATSVVPVLGGDPSWGRPKLLGVTLALLSTVPVAFRARRPLVMAAVVLAANGACIFAAAPRQAAFQPFVALVLVAYSAGSRAEGRRAIWVPPLLAAAAVPVFVAAVLHGQDPGNALPSFVWLLAAWVIGRTVRSLRRKTVALEAANRELGEQRELQAQAAVAVERGRIARELHDVVAHNVSMMVVQAGAAARVLDGEQPHVRNALDVIAVTGRETVDEMRALLGVLRSDDGPAALRPQPGLADLEQLICGVREAGLPVTLRIEGTQCPLPAALDLSAFRIVQEALTNALKHAGPADARVTVRYQARAVELEIADTGAGPAGPAGRAGSGHGLVGMRERAAMFGGELQAASSGRGFTVRARLPLSTPAPA